MQVYCSLFEESRSIVCQKLSVRFNKKVVDEWTSGHCEKVVPGQEIATPKKVTPSKLLKLFTLINFFTFLSHLSY